MLTHMTRMLRHAQSDLIWNGTSARTTVNSSKYLAFTFEVPMEMQVHTICPMTISVSLSQVTARSSSPKHLYDRQHRVPSLQTKTLTR